MWNDTYKGHTTNSVPDSGGGSVVYEERIPDGLKEEDRWVCWQNETRNGKSTKVPVNPSRGGYAQVDTPETWSDFDTALDYYKQSGSIDGIGFVFQEDGNFAGADLDDCRNPKTIEVDDWAKEIIYELDSYTERSPSGTGYHIIVSGDVPSGGNRNGEIEMYDSHRYFTVTGDHLTGTPRSVEYRTQQLQEIHHDYIADQEPSTGPSVEQSDIPLPDRDLLEKAENAANGDKFQALWNGDTSGYTSHSEADQALCTMLAFWTGGDPQRIEALFSQSGLVRDKWRNRPDYRDRTIGNAIRYCDTYYYPDG